jgi:hypothetical protein
MLLIGVTAEAGFSHDGRGGLSMRAGPEAASVALGGTGCASARPSAFSANPAALPFSVSPVLAVGHGGLVEGINSSITSVSLVYPLGGSHLYPGAGAVARHWAIGLGLEHLGLELSQGSSWSRQLISAGVGYAPLPFVSTGLSVKMLIGTSDVDGLGATGAGLDIGGRLEISPQAALGVSLRNVFSSVSWEEGEDESAPVEAAGGLLVRYIPMIDVEIEGALDSDDQYSMRGGAELCVPGTGLRLRAGGSYISGDYDRWTPSAGFGYRLGSFAVDYGVHFDEDNALGTIHRFALIYGRPGMTPKAVPEAGRE